MSFQSAIRLETRHWGGTESIRQGLLHEIRKGINVIAGLDNPTYRRRSNHSASVGEQFRHNLDFLNRFLNGIAIVRIDYTLRERDVRVERSREFAITRFEQVARELLKITRDQLGSIVLVRSEIAGATWLQSSVARELEFVLSHTIHHHALIAEKLAGLSVSLDETIGVAPSTQRHWERLAA